MPILLMHQTASLLPNALERVKLIADWFSLPIADCQLEISLTSDDVELFGRPQTEQPGAKCR